MTAEHDRIVKPLPKWVMQKYSALWCGFKDNAFHHSQADDILDENTSVIISHLKRNGWIDVTLDPEDSRKRLYRLKSPEEAIMGIADEANEGRKDDR